MRQDKKLKTHFLFSTVCFTHYQARMWEQMKNSITNHPRNSHRHQCDEKQLTPLFIGDRFG